MAIDVEDGVFGERKHRLCRSSRVAIIPYTRRRIIHKEIDQPIRVQIHKKKKCLECRKLKGARLQLEVRRRSCSNIPIEINRAVVIKDKEIEIAVSIDIDKLMVGCIDPSCEGLCNRCAEHRNGNRRDLSSERLSLQARRSKEKEE